MVVAKFNFYKPWLKTAATTGLSAKSFGIVAAVFNRGMKNNAIPTSYGYGIFAFQLNKSRS